MDDAGNRGGETIGFERLLAAEHFIEDQAERKKIGAAVVGPLEQDFRGHVGGSAARAVMVSMLLVASSGLLFQARRATPKSRIFTRLPGASMMFSGLISPWMMPFSWAACRPSQHWMAMEKNSSVEMGRVSRWRKVSPSTYSMTSQSSPSCSRTSWIAPTLG